MTQQKAYRLFYGLLFLLSLNSCVRDGMDTDCDSYIRFVYDYNMQYTDLFSKEASRMHLYIFDEEDVLVHKVVDEVSGTFPEYYRIPLSLTPGKYNIVAWSGVYEESYQEDELQTYASQRSDLGVHVKSMNVSRVVDDKLRPLWHGAIEQEWNPATTATISLTKNTNTLRLVLADLDGAEMNVDDFEIFLTSANGDYLHDNTPIGEEYFYYPYYTETDPEVGAIAEMSTLRLMEDQENTLEIIHKIPVKVYWEVPLILINI